MKLKIEPAWREFANRSGIDASNLETKRAFYAGVKWMDRSAGGCHELSTQDFFELMMAVKSELAEFSGQTLQQYLANKSD